MMGCAITLALCGLLIGGAGLEMVIAATDATSANWGVNLAYFGVSAVILAGMIYLDVRTQRRGRRRR
jgi:hypothetical protein